MDAPPQVQKVDVKVSLTGAYEFPQNFYLVSPVLWIHSVSQMSITQFEIEHCSRPENTSKLNFVRTDGTQMEPPCKFNILRGGSFLNDSHCGVINLEQISDSFGLAIVQEGSDEREYYVMVYSTYQQSVQYKIDVVMTWNTKAHRSVSDDKLSYAVKTY